MKIDEIFVEQVRKSIRNKCFQSLKIVYPHFVHPSFSVEFDFSITNDIPIDIFIEDNVLHIVYRKDNSYQLVHKLFDRECITCELETIPEEIEEEDALEEEDIHFGLDSWDHTACGKNWYDCIYISDIDLVSCDKCLSSEKFKEHKKYLELKEKSRNKESKETEMVEKKSDKKPKRKKKLVHLRYSDCNVSYCGKPLYGNNYTREHYKCTCPVCLGIYRRDAKVHYNKDGIETQCGITNFEACGTYITDEVTCKNCLRSLYKRGLIDEEW